MNNNILKQRVRKELDEAITQTICECGKSVAEKLNMSRAFGIHRKELENVFYKIFLEIEK